MKSYAGLSGPMAPVVVQNVMRGIGRVFGVAKKLRISDGVGDGPFEDGARRVGGTFEIYKGKYAKKWADERMLQLDASIDAMPKRFKRRAAACVSAVLGIEGDDPVEELVVWLDPYRSGPQYWAIRAAHAVEVPVYDLSNPDTLEIWIEWVKANTLQPATK